MNKINFNENVYFKLTKKGEGIILDYCRDLNSICANMDIKYNLDSIVKTDDIGNQYMQLWDFMRVFGNHMYNGAEPVTECNNIFFK